MIFVYLSWFEAEERVAHVDSWYIQTDFKIFDGLNGTVLLSELLFKHGIDLKNKIKFKIWNNKYPPWMIPVWFELKL